MLTFAAAVFFLIISPGPGVLSTAGVAAGFGVKPATRYVFGLFLGNTLVSFMVYSGLATLIFANGQIRSVLLFISLGYLVYLAFKIARAGNRIGFIEKSTTPGILDGIFLQVVNPKAYVVGTTLFSGFAFMPNNYWAEVLTKLLIFNSIWIPIHFLWLFLGIFLNRLDLSDRAHSVVNLAMAGSLLVVAILAALQPAQSI